MQHVMLSSDVNLANSIIIYPVKAGIYQTIFIFHSKGERMFRNRSGCHPRLIGYRNWMWRESRIFNISSNVIIDFDTYF